MNKRFAIILVVLVALFGGILWANKRDAAAPQNGGSGNGQASNHIKGEGKKSVSLVEYADFQCPGCGYLYPLVKQVVEKYQSDITFQFVHYPLSQIHPNAMAAHRAAEAASKQGKFWEMYDLLFSQRDTWVNSSSVASIFESFAQQLNLDQAAFKTDAASAAINDIIQTDIKKGQGAGVDATPTFFLDGKKIENTPQTLEQFSELIDKAIAEKNQ